MSTFERPGRTPLYPKGTHGNHCEYSRGCRCFPCRKAFAERQNERRDRLRKGIGDFVVSAEFARQHLRYLSKNSVGYRAVADVTGIKPRMVQMIRTGKHKRILQSTEEKIMRVTAAAVSDAATISAETTNALVGELIAEGFSRGYLAHRMGYKRPELQFYGEERVLAKTELRVKKLHAELHRSQVDRMLELVSVIRKAA